MKGEFENDGKLQEIQKHEFRKNVGDIRPE